MTRMAMPPSTSMMETIQGENSTVLVESLGNAADDHRRQEGHQNIGGKALGGVVAEQAQADMQQAAPIQHADR